MATVDQPIEVTVERKGEDVETARHALLTSIAQCARTAGEHATEAGSLDDAAGWASVAAGLTQTLDLFEQVQRIDADFRDVKGDGYESEGHRLEERVKALSRQLAEVDARTIGSTRLG